MAEPVWLGGAAEGWLRRRWRGETPAPLALLLAPAEAVYRCAVLLRNGLYARELLPLRTLGVPVVSVGNIQVGGSGKTPIARHIVGQLLSMGGRPGILHGGYGADEPALHRIWHPQVPVVAGRDRSRAGLEAIRLGADVLVLDDGFQHRRLRRDLDVVVVAAESWERTPRLLPSGPWRESPRALRRADVVVVTRRTAPPERAEEVRAALRILAPAAKLAQVRMLPGGWRSGTSWLRRARTGSQAFPPGDPPPDPEGPIGEVLAVSGIARPELFVGSLRELGMAIGEAVAYPDHHPFGDDDVAEIARRADGRPVVVTEKDAVKIAPRADGLDLWVLEQETEVEIGGETLRELLRRAIT